MQHLRRTSYGFGLQSIAIALGSFNSSHTVFDDASQDFRDAPSLGKTTARTMRRIAVENLGDMAEAGFRQMPRENSQPPANLILNLLSVAVHFEVRIDKRTQQP